MRVEFAPRILVEDIRNFSPNILCLDIRAPEEFNMKNFPGSINLNLKETTFKDLNSYQGKHITIIGDRGDNAVKVCLFFIFFFLIFIIVFIFF